MIAIIFGAGSIAMGIWGIHRWLGELIVVLKGIVPLSIVIAGIIAILAGISSLRK